MKPARAIIIGSVLLAATDGIMKYLILKQPSWIKEGCFDSFICFNLHQNQGIAFSIPLPMWLTLIISGGILAFILQLIFYFHKSRSALLTPIILIFLGALGNFLDRIINGFTTDYLIFFQRSAINISDILIVTGAILLVWYHRRTDMK